MPTPMIALSTREVLEGRQRAWDEAQRKATVSPDSSVLSAAQALLSLTPSRAPSRSQSPSASPTYSPPQTPPELVSSADEASESSSDGYQSEWTEAPASAFGGSVSLALDEDDEALSPLHCFMRRYCVEAFSATADDMVNMRSHKSSTSSSVSLGQVGIRCLYCKHRSPHQKQERAVCFPSSLKNIYHSIETWQRRHSLVCRDIPAWVKTNLMRLMHQSRSGAGGRRQYWEESARRLGMETTATGIRFVRTPGEYACSHDGDDSVHSTSNQGAPVVSESDGELVTPFLFLLLDQMEVCYFSEKDRSGGRSKVKDCPVGQPGMQCKHCKGKAGFGRYFPTNVAGLTSANSDRNIYNHITKCRKCPSQVRESLQHLQHTQHQQKNRRGSRKVFFERIWSRLHEDSER